MNIIVFPLFKNCINSHEFVKLYYITKFAEKKFQCNMFIIIGAIYLIRVIPICDANFFSINNIPSSGKT